MVLLRRASDAPSKRLQQLAVTPGLIAQYFWHAANTVPDDLDTPAHVQEDAAKRLLKVEKRAAHAPAAALRILNGVPPSSPEEAAPSLARKFAPRPGPEIAAPTTTAPPDWIHIDSLRTLAARLARAAAPGADGWTRETVLASLHPHLAPAWEFLVNAIARAQVPAGPLATLIRGGRLAAWPKTGGHRIVGMTSAVTKTAWKACIAQHLRCRAMHPCVATYAAGGATGVLRWARTLGAVHCGDVADAFWSVDRREIQTALVTMNSPAAHIYNFVYGTPPVVAHGSSRSYRSDFGLIPGCAGASFAFALAMSLRLAKTALTPDVLAVFADDVSAASPAHLEELEAALAPNFVLVKKRDTLSQPQKLFGSFLGPNASAPATEWIAEKCAEMRRVAALPLSCQARLALINAVERSLRWFAMATPPELIAQCYGAIDAAITDASLALAPRDATPSRKTGTLLFLPQASGGAGFISYGAHGPRIYEAAATTWPPTSTSELPDHGAASKPRSWSTMREAIDEITVESARAVLPRHYIEAHADSAVAWFNIARVTKHEEIRNEDWALFWAHTIGMQIPYTLCNAARPDELAWDHIHSCNTCGTAFKTARHDRVATALNSAARRYGVVSSMDFFANFGTPYSDDRPDIVFYRLGEEKLPLVVDLTVRHHAQGRDAIENALTRGAQVKKRKYRDWFANEVEFEPLVFSTLATMPPPTFKVIKEISKHALPGFVHHAIRRVKCAILSETALRRRVLSARFASTAAQQATVASSPWKKQGRLPDGSPVVFYCPPIIAGSFGLRAVVSPTLSEQRAALSHH